MRGRCCGRGVWAGRDAWQFPQGGIHAGESVKEAMYRELFEEVGLEPEAGRGGRLHLRLAALPAAAPHAAAQLSPHLVPSAPE